MPLEEHTKEQTYRANWRTVVLTVFGFLLLAVATVFLIGNWQTETELADRQIVEERIERLAKLQEEDAQSVGVYGWADAEKQQVQIPVEKAMNLVIEELQNKPVRGTGENPLQ